MIPARLAPDAQRTAPLAKQVARTRGERNDAWIRRVLARQLRDRKGPFVLLLGGAAVSHFRVRVAQSHARADLLPSYWSHVALLARTRAAARLWHVPLAVGDIDDLPRRNGIAAADLGEFADPARYPNLALLSFGDIPDAALRASIRTLESGRLAEDLTSPILAWLAFVWGTRGHHNPLLAGTPLPSAQFISTLFAQANIDLTPGLSERVVCPEAIWQAALWWGRYYEQLPADDGPRGPAGAHVLGQPAAAAVEFAGPP